MDKVRSFIWRAASNCIPTLMALRSRHVEVSAMCPVCNGSPEDTLHALVKCPRVRSIWNQSLLGDLSGSINCFSSWWQLVKSRQKPEEVCMTAMVAWSIWNNRNDIVWNGKSKNDRALLNSAQDSLLQWQMGCDSQNDNSHKGEENAIKTWKKPETGWLKCNVDAATFHQQGLSGFGCVIRDEKGSFIAAKNGLLVGFFDPFLAEIMSCREVLSWLKTLGINKVIVEMDALNVFHALINSNMDFSYAGSIIDDCKILAQDLFDCSFAFVKRSANQVAHTLARVTGSMSDLGEWFLDYPLFISRVLAMDDYE